MSTAIIDTITVCIEKHENRFRIPVNAKFWYCQCTREKRDDVSFLMRLVSFHSRRVSQDGGKLPLSGTVIFNIKNITRF